MLVLKIKCLYTCWRWTRSSGSFYGFYGLILPCCYYKRTFYLKGCKSFTFCRFFNAAMAYFVLTTSLKVNSTKTCRPPRLQNNNKNNNNNNNKRLCCTYARRGNLWFHHVRKVSTGTWASSAGREKKKELATSSLEFEYLHRKESIRNADWRIWY